MIAVLDDVLCVHSLITDEYCDRLDTWESDQSQYTPTLIVLKHFQALFERDLSASAQDTDDCDNVAAKKRKIDANNKNYRVAGIDLMSDIDSLTVHCSSLVDDVAGIDMMSLCSFTL